MSERLDRPLDWHGRFALKFHLAMCGPCSRCNRQFALMHRVGERFDAETDERQAGE